MATVITSSALVDAFGAYYINSGQNEQNIHNRLREEFGTAEAFRTVDSEDTILREANSGFTEVLQSFQKTFTPKGGVALAPKSIPLFNVKVDELFYPDDLKNQWAAFFTSDVLDRTQWPFVRWFIEEYVLKQIKVDLEKQAIYKGQYAAPTPGVPNDAIETMNGIKFLIDTAIADGGTVVIPTGAPSATPATWAAQVEAFAGSVDELYWDQEMTLNMSRQNALKYSIGRRTKYNMYYPQAPALATVEDFPNITIVGRASMNGSNKIWMSPKVNSILAFKGGSNKDIVEVEKVDRQVKVYTDFWIGAGFIDDGLIFTNDQDIEDFTI